MGVSRKTFTAAIHGLEPDLTLPDLELPSRKGRPQPQQAEFVQTPADYIRETSIARLADRGKKLAAEHRATLAQIEQQYGVPPSMILAIWGRETAYGGHKLPHNAIRVLATQGYLRPAQGHVPRGVPRTRSRSWRRATSRSPTCAAPGAARWGSRNSCRRNSTSTPSISTATAAATSGPRCRTRSPRRRSSSSTRAGSAAQRWAYEVRAPASVDCTIGVPEFKQPVGEWLQRGFAPPHGRQPSQNEFDEPASLLQPEGTYGPTFLTLNNYFVIKEYNFSDLYVLFVGHLSDRIGDPRPFETPWSKNTQLKSTQVESMQNTLTKLGLYKDKIDGKAGMLTRSALGHYQKANRLKVDCWPTAAVLEHMQAKGGSELTLSDSLKAKPGGARAPAG